MRPPLPFALSSSAAVLALCLVAHADPQASARAALRVSYASRDSAFMKKDIKGSLSPYNSKTVFIDADGKRLIGLAAQRRTLSKFFASNASFSSADTEITEFIANTRGTEATTKALRHIALTAKPLTGQTNLRGVDEAVHDHWVKGKDGWRVTRERRLTAQTLLELCQGGSSDAVLEKPVKNSIVGKWIGNLPSRPGTTARTTAEFREDGTESQTIMAPRQIISIQATYTAKGRLPTQTLVSGTKNGQDAPNEGQVQILHYEIQGDTLLISSGAGSDTIRLTKQPDQP